MSPPISKTASSSDSVSSWLTAFPFSTFVSPSETTSIESPDAEALVFGASLVESPAALANSDAFFSASLSDPTSAGLTSAPPLGNFAASSDITSVIVFSKLDIRILPIKYKFKLFN